MFLAVSFTLVSTRGIVANTMSLCLFLLVLWFFHNVYLGLDGMDSRFFV